MAAYKGGEGLKQGPTEVKGKHSAMKVLHESTAIMTGLTFSEETLKATAKKVEDLKKNRTGKAH